MSDFQLLRVVLLAQVVPSVGAKATAVERDTRSYTMRAQIISMLDVLLVMDDLVAEFCFRNGTRALCGG